MKFPHLFEFMDQSWLPESLAATLREILSCGNARPFRPYYSWVAKEAKRETLAHGCKTVVELGAGTAPISRLLAEDPELEDVRIVPCDARPDPATFADLARRYPGRIAPCFDPVDFSQPQAWQENTLLILSGTIHHLPEPARQEALRAMTTEHTRVMIAEPLRRTLPSMGFVLLSIVPALLLPLWYFGRPGNLRRFLWCWLLPVAGLMFVWDGLASCVRMWTEAEWRSRLASLLGSQRSVALRHSLFSQMVTW